MNAEFIAVLEHMEREKGVSRQVLLEAVESALVSAARKVIPNKESDVQVKIDPKTGDISVVSDGKKIDSSGFGRIAAQTAKQVIIQKIREAERAAIYDEYHTRVNNIVNGTVYRYEKGAIVIDLGKTEAILPKREQSPRDSFRQGDRIRAYVIEVANSAKGPQIVVSRTHPGLLKRLFELEVPEVLEGVVEIKGVARDPGDRAKIAVWSKDERVDCVGACVGMRGMRVKNIVRELQGEKIDIVRWSEDVVEYVQASLSPAQCSQVLIANQDEKRIEVIVDEEQLSLAIGKNGQNVRLAAKLTGWMIDIRSRKEIAKEKLEAHEAKPAKRRLALADLKLTDLDGVGPKVEEALVQAGYSDVSTVATLSIEDLMRVDGIGEKTAQKIYESSRHLVSTAPEVSEPEAPVEGTPAEEMSAENDSAEGAGGSDGVINTPVEEVPAEETPAEEAPPEPEAPKEE